MRNLYFVISVLFLTSPAFAEIKPDAGTDQLCTGFEETLEGVWVDNKNRPVLAFRFGSNRGGVGCYAWLNTLPSWNIEAAGALILPRVNWNGNQRKFRSGKAELLFDTGTGGARLINLEGREARGKIIQ
ncbi:hypothetical protein [Shimia abyssi]|uniref:Protease inhibitor Inh n=1 Tax=Shimia abyssi TaxID=1662395 RepID=A0A2P8FKT7_9RHOB|nr:hypothetical protein [Shimia abyssi]PSL22354.1 hypothetical protein CLV88_101783 [Shimia abyssi]